MRSVRRACAVVLSFALTAVIVAVSDPLTARADPTGGMWLTQSEIDALPTSGAAWDQLLAAADGSLGVADISDQTSDHDV